MSHYPEPDHYIRDKVKVVLDFSNFATKKELNKAARVDTSDLASKCDFIPFKSEIDNLDRVKLVNIQTNSNNLKLKVDDLDVAKFETVVVDLKKISDVVDKQVVKNIQLLNST